MSLCTTGEKFIEEATRQGLTNELYTIIKEIQGRLFIRAQLANPSSDVRIPPRYTLRSLGVTIPSDVRVIELQESDLLQLIPSYHPGTLRGLYIPQFGKLFLNRELWCIETFIHETLHAVSIFSVKEDVRERLHLLMDGLTEFYTGYLLRQVFHDCYEICWRKNIGSRCYCTYQQQVKIWASFCRFIPINETLRIYFWNGSIDWESKWAEFMRRIREFGYPGFKDIFQERYTIPSWIYFHQECIKNLGKEYERIYSSTERCLELSEIKV